MSAFETVAVGAATHLSDDETDRLLSRLPPIKSDRADRKPFAVREKSPPPPLSGATVQAPFPPPATAGGAAPVTPDNGPLDVVRHLPDGKVPLAPVLSVTFNQPMVAIASHEDLAAEDVPLRISPPTPGRWRWVGTRTILFEPAPRFPMATQYTVTVPPGTVSASGSRLDRPIEFSFSTPPPRLVSSYPGGGPQSRDPIMVMVFDQKIDPAAVLQRTYVVTGSGSAPILRLATADEIADDPRVASITTDANRDHCVAFRATAPLPPNTSVTLIVKKGTPSVEGSLVTETDQSFVFRTYGPFRIDDWSCKNENGCMAGTPLTIHLSNPIAPGAFRKSLIAIAPAIKGMRVVARGNDIAIFGPTKGHTKYSATVDRRLTDTFEQTLEGDNTVSFYVGDATQSLQMGGGQFAVLDPSGKPSWAVYSVNKRDFHITVYSVQPGDWLAFTRYFAGWRQKDPPPPPGRPVMSQVVPIDGARDEVVETDVDLSPALPNGRGQLVIVVEPTEVPTTPAMREKFVSWVQATHIGLDAFVDRKKMVVWTNSLKDGRPLAGVKVALAPQGTSAESDGNGLAQLALPANAPGGPAVLVARSKDDVAILPEYTFGYSGGSGWTAHPLTDELRWYVFDDRKMYRPSEEVHIKGWVRVVQTGPRGDLAVPKLDARGMSWRLTDSRGNEALSGKTELDAFGGFDFSFTLPKTMNLGSASLQLQSQMSYSGASTTHYFQVQEFRRPEFEVTASTAQGPFFVGQGGDVTVNAHYYAGGALPNAPVTWSVTAAPASFTPPGRSDFTFGTWTPWWQFGQPVDFEGGAVPSLYAAQQPAQTLQGRTDGNGKHRMHLAFTAVSPSRPTSLFAQATVQDVNRQAWTAHTTMLVHPSADYVGLKTERTFVQQGQTMPVSLVVCDVDGNIVAGRNLHLRLARQEWSWDSDKIEEIGVQERDLKSTSEVMSEEFTLKEGGEYRLRARVEDEKGRLNESEITFWVAGGKSTAERDVKQERVTLIPDRKEYQPGETAHVLVQAPFSDGSGLLTVRRNNIVETRTFSVKDGSATLDLKITEDLIPNVNIEVDVEGSAPRTDDSGQADESQPKRPAYASGKLDLSVPPLARVLTVKAVPVAAKVDPGGSTDADVLVCDVDGKPVPNAEVAVVAVDEAVLALTSYKLRDPMTVFYADRADDVREWHSRASVLLGGVASQAVLAYSQTSQVFSQGPGGAFPTSTGAAGAFVPATGAPMALARAASAGREETAVAQDALKGASDTTPIRLRSDFNPLAVFAPRAATDRTGRVRVHMKVPDNLTRYRIMAVAVAGGKQFGFGENYVTARLPLMARIAAPRFLNFGDKFALPIVLQNQTDKPMNVEVAARAFNADFTDGAGRQVTVAANDRVEVRIPMETVAAGTARFQIAAAATDAKASDAAEASLPVWTPATSEAFAVYGEIDEGGVTQPVQPPKDVFMDYGGLSVTTSSTQLQALTDAVLYLVHYPFECAEQVSSRVLSVAALRDVLSAFKAEGLPSSVDIVEGTNKDIEKLRSLQGADGGFALWQVDEQEWPFVTVHVTHALVMAKRKGFDVPQETLSRAHAYLRDIESHCTPIDWYPPSVRRAVASYALYVRHLMGDDDVVRARSLIAEAGGVDKMPMEALGWLLMVMSKHGEARYQADAIRTYLANHVTEEAGTASFATHYDEGTSYVLFASDRRTDAVLLEALIEDNPKSDLIPKLVRGLLDHRVRGHWENTQEDTFILLALDKYFHTYERVAPNFVARIWLGDTYAGQHAFHGRGTDRQVTEIPINDLEKQKRAQNLVLIKQGAGRLYYRLGMQYAPSDLKLGPAEHGFSIERTYQPMDNADDVIRQVDGKWQIKAGARVRVRITMITTARRYHVALVDPLPAGLEAVNPVLAVNGDEVAAIPAAAIDTATRRRWYGWSGGWYEHQNLRDDRAEAFTSLLWDGVYTYEYVCRATTPGRFIVPPARAEEMYHPETFGRSASDFVEVR